MKSAGIVVTYADSLLRGGDGLDQQELENLVSEIYAWSIILRHNSNL